MSRIDDIDCGTPRGIQDIPCRQTKEGGDNQEDTSTEDTNTEGEGEGGEGE